MQKLFIFFLLIVLGNGYFAHSQENNHFISKSFLIILSTKSYESALKIAKEASEKLSIDLELRDLYPDEELGLNTDEQCGCGEWHGYIARGRYDDGNYVSIEYTDYYNSFAEGYYIVVVSNGERSQLKPILKKVKTHFKDAYIKNSMVYIGCMH